MAPIRYRFYKQFFLLTSVLLISMATVYKTGPAAIYRSTHHYLEHLLGQDGVSGERRTAWTRAGSATSGPELGSATSGPEFLQRRRSVRDACARRNNWEGLGRVGSVLTDDRSGLVYCLVPKAGCTYWKRLFESLHRQGGKNRSRDDFDIPREVIHQLPTSQGTQYDERVHGPDHYPTRVLVYRDPFDRLLASYLDKFYLPDFWEDYGQTFMEMVQGIDQQKVEKTGEGKNRTCKWSQPDPVGAGDFMRRHFVEMKSKFGEQQTSDSACGKYLTFTEFLVSSMYDPEPHWRPLHQLCDPCKFLPTHIINMDTFTQDTRHLLQTRGISDFLAASVAEQVSEEMHMLVEYHFSRVSHSVFLSTCLTPRELAYRLWHSFLWKGYIPPSSGYRLPDLISLSDVKRDLLEQLRRARAQGQDEADLRSWRDGYKSRFFSDVRAPIWLELFRKFQIDLDIFGWSQFEKDVLNCIV
ncbi:carbohydrate sulfotransferase 12-like [Physella acuta]|uniref:carbohydrate sulfotransferase 12-like n=1 Tax=Physella acuta TaxID=109671 RepID=UPI0027DB2875|nr:carbohydrate sulfotransferase 12-like [Physella acuta]